MNVAYSYARVSSTEQRKGKDFDANYRTRLRAERNGWTLDTSLTFKESKSAFRSKNLKTGLWESFWRQPKKSGLSLGPS